MGKSGPDWYRLADEYLRRMPRNFRPQIVEVSPSIVLSNRNSIIKNDTQKLIHAIPKSNLIIGLDERGEMITTKELAHNIAHWNMEYQSVSILIGGANGIDSNYLKSLTVVWSLSRLTLPYQLARIVLIEQLYRAWTILDNHPYHRD